MKKIISFIIFAICSLALFSCSNNSNVSAVKLQNLTAYTTETNTKKELNVKRENELSYNYLIIEKDTQYVELKITLDNPKDYHIFRFYFKM
jgi:hypothetical protein